MANFLERSAIGAAIAAVILMVFEPSFGALAGPDPQVAIGIDNFTFNAPTLTVKTGTTVTWTNNDDIPHTVVAKDRSFHSKALDSGERYSFTFTKAGQYGYFCSIHPHMTGDIIVKA